MTKAKISIADDPELRAELDHEYELASQVQLCKYALKLAAHIRELINYSDPDNVTITKSLLINELWQKGIARVHDVRQASITIHQMAKTSEDAAVCAGLRVIGHAVATGHMREHAMVTAATLKHWRKKRKKWQRHMTVRSWIMKCHMAGFRRGIQ